MSVKLTGSLALFLARFRENQKGATAIEYGLVLVLISIAAIVAFQTLGDSVSNMFGAINSDFNEAMPGAGAGGSGGASDVSSTN